VTDSDEEPKVWHLQFFRSQYQLTLALLSPTLCISGIVPLLILLNQHVCQLVRLDPKSRRAELLDHQVPVRQVELAESQRKKSIAKKAESCYSDRAVKLKSRQDLLSQTIHETLDACGSYGLGVIRDRGIVRTTN
jgi:hypothetical protein